MSKPIHDPLSKKLNDASHVEVKNTTCYMCACRCGNRDHEAVFAGFNRYP